MIKEHPKEDEEEENKNEEKDEIEQTYLLK